jgi:hypothetical protein
MDVPHERTDIFAENEVLHFDLVTVSALDASELS